MMKNKVCILSSVKFENKIKEDVLLKYEIQKYYECDIIAWEKITSKTIEEYSIFIVKSVWGYHRNFSEFLKLIENIERAGKFIFNTYQNILFDISKYNQYEFMQKNDIPTIPTFWLKEYKINETNGEQDYIIKPVISASGENTKKIKLAEIEQIKKEYEKFENVYNNKLIIQPFIEDIINGEISCIVINDTFRYAVKRFPGIFTEEKNVEYLSELELPLLELLETIINKLKKFDFLFYRVDFVKNNDEYLVIEMEMIDPDLFIRNIPINIQQKVLKEIVKTINKKVLESEK